MKVNRNSKITLHFALANAQTGALIDTNFDQPPATFSYGDGSLLPAFETALLGLEEGAQVSFTFTPEQAFGAVREDNIHRFPRDQFASIELEEDLMIDFSGPNQVPTTGIVKEISEGSVLIDFNHPLAGASIEFEVQIISIETADDTLFVQAIDDA